LLNKSSAIDINLALTIYKTLIRPIITYAAPAWGYDPKTHFKELQVFQNKVLRIITKLPRVTPTDILHEQTAMETIKNHVRKNPVRTSKRTPYFTITKINWLTLFTFNPLKPKLV
jgi:hypothetical protein